MPNVYDPRGHQLRITHSPTERAPFEFGKLPKLDLQTILGSVRDTFIQQIKDLMGIDLSSPAAFLASLIQLITNDGPGGGFAAKILSIIGDSVGIPDLIARLSRMLTNLQHAFGGGADFGDPGFDLPAAISGLIDNLLPHGRLAELIGGKLKDGQEPQKLLDILTGNLVDASRIGNLANIGALAQSAITNLIEDLSAKAWGSDLQSLIDRFWGQIFGDDNASGHTISDWRDAVRSLFNLSDGAAAGAGTALSLLNFPLSQPLFGHTNPTVQVPFGHLHLRKYTASGSVVSTATDPESIAVTQTQSAGIFNRFDKSRDTDVVPFLCKASGTISACTLHLWRMDVTPNSATIGNLTYIRSEAITPAALPTASFDNFNVQLGAPIHVDPGTVIGKELTITGSGTLAVSGVDEPYAKDDLTARPKRLGFSRAVNAGATPPATIVDASVTYTTRMPNIGLGQLMATLPPQKFTYTDGFNSTGNWKALSGALRVSGGIFQTGGNASNFSLFTPAINSDQGRVEFDLRTVWTALNPDFNTGDVIRLLMFATTSASQWVGVEIQSNASLVNPFAASDLRIVSGFGVGDTRTVRSVDVGGVNATSNDRIAFDYTQATSTYGLYINNATTPATSWVDSGGAISHGPGYRQAAIYTNFGASGKNVCDNFLYKDV